MADFSGVVFEKPTPMYKKFWFVGFGAHTSKMESRHKMRLQMVGKGDLVCIVICVKFGGK